MQNLTEPIEFIDRIHRAEVKYLLIGRRAVIAYGGPVQTMDYDIYIDNSEKNIDLFLKIAENFELYPGISRERIKKHFKFKLENDFVLDVFCMNHFVSDGGKISFKEMYERRHVAEGETGLKVNLPSVDDLISLKKLRSLPKDLLDIEYLEVIKKQIEDSGKC